MREILEVTLPDIELETAFNLFEINNLEVEVEAVFEDQSFAYEHGSKTGVHEQWDCWIEKIRIIDEHLRAAILFWMPDFNERYVDQLTELVGEQ
jgi:hypothetical protein